MTTVCGTHYLEVDGGPAEGGEAQIPAVAEGVLELEQEVGGTETIPVGM